MIKFSPCIPWLALALTALAPIRAQTPPPPAETTPAQRDEKALWEIWNEERPANISENSEEYWKFQDDKSQRFAAGVLAFIAKYPHDPIGYNVTVQRGYSTPFFITGFKPEFKDMPKSFNLITDQDKRAAFVEAQIPLMAEIVKAPDSVRRQRGGAVYWMIIEADQKARRTKQPIDLGPVRALADYVVEKYGDERAVLVVQEYTKALRRTSPSEADAYEAKIKAIPAMSQAFAVAAEAEREQREKEQAAAKLRAADLSSLQFVAADGRQVNLGALRGRVILVDFWATWCGPCVAELPNVKKVYSEYHDRGFEVIGISLENSGTRPTDSPAQAAVKIAAAKAKLMEFTEKNGMPWPQYFDGKWWQNDLSKKFGIGAIPAMFLIDRNGQIAAADARGPDLEVQVKKLLGL